MSQLLSTLLVVLLLLLAVVVLVLVGFVIVVLFYIPRRKKECFSSQNVFQNVQIILCCGLSLWLGADSRRGGCLPKEVVSGVGVPAVWPLCKGPQHLLRGGGRSSGDFMCYIIASRTKHQSVLKFFLISLEGILIYGRNSQTKKLPNDVHGVS